MALHTKWTSGDITFYDATQDVFKIKDNTDGIIIGEDDEGVDVQFYGETTGAYILWSGTTADKLAFIGGANITLDGGDISLGDDDQLILGDTGNFAIACDGASLDVVPDVPHVDMELGSSALPLDVKFFGNTAAVYAKWQSSGDTLDFVGADISLNDSDYIYFGTTNDFSLGFDGTNLDIIPDVAHVDLELGSFTYPLDVKFFGNTGVAYMQWQSSGDTLKFTSGASIELGTSGYITLGDTGNFTLGFDATNLDIIPDVAHVDLELGSATYPLDVKFFGNTGTATMKWESSGDRLTLTSGASIKLGTSGSLTFGDTGDFAISFDATELNILPDVAHVDLELGSFTYPLDVKFFGNTGVAYMKWESSGDRLLLTSGAGIKLGTSGSLTFGDTGNFAIAFDATELNILPDVPHVDLELGSSANPLDVKMFGNTAAVYVKWQSSGDTLDLVGADISLNDSDVIYLGTTNDFAVSFDGTNLDIIPDVAHVDLELGSASLPLDVKMFGNTGAAYVKWVSSGDELVLFDADISLGDADYIKFGATDEATISWTTGDSLEITTTGGNLFLNSIITYQDPDTTGSTGTIDLGTTSNRIQFLSSTSTGYFVTIPQSTLSAGIEFKIFNLSTVNNALKVYENTTGGTLIATVADNYAAIVVSDGTQWGHILGSTQY